ncbi:MAG: hypothetical protein R3D03_07765 [Geminicoccaceae bacterium]
MAREAFGLDQPMIVQFFSLPEESRHPGNGGGPSPPSEKVFDILAHRFLEHHAPDGGGVAADVCDRHFRGHGHGLAARRQADLGATGYSPVMQSAPPFITGIPLLIVLSYCLTSSPQGDEQSGNRPGDLLDFIVSPTSCISLVLPTITITAYYFGDTDAHHADLMSKCWAATMSSSPVPRGCRPAG